MVGPNNKCAPSGLDVLLNCICIMRSSRAPMIRVNHSMLPRISAVDPRGSHLVESRTCARQRGGKSSGWGSRLTSRLCDASSAALRFDGELHSDGDYGQSHSEALQKKA